MKFEEALQAMRQGKLVSIEENKLSPLHIIYKIKDNKMYRLLTDINDISLAYSINCEDILSENWYITTNEQGRKKYLGFRWLGKLRVLLNKIDKKILYHMEKY